jgi:hypothetical protein
MPEVRLLGETSDMQLRQTLEASEIGELPQA